MPTASQSNAAPADLDLPMAGRTFGGRSPVTCHLKCADACTHPVPNTSDNETFRDIAGGALNRRRMLGLAGAGALALTAGPAMLGAGAAAAAPPTADGAAPATLAQKADRGRVRDFLPFAAIEPVDKAVDAFTVPRGYTWQTLIRWGDPILPGGTAFDVMNQTAAKQALSFGYNNDYTDIIATDAKGRSALLVCNHEYVNPGIMFPPTLDAAETRAIARAAHGMSVVELERSKAGRPWSYRRTGARNRRITVDTPFRFTGPAAGDPLLQTVADPSGTTVLGTLGNCSGGTTPWGTVLSGEENFNGYFRSAGTTPAELRYGLADRATTLGWENDEPRWDARNPGYANEINRFGWIVEVDPMDPTSTPVKHTALGRLKHEGANVIVANRGNVVAYTGDDERFDYLYKFVSTARYRKGDRAHNKTLLTDGDLFVARFFGDSPPIEIDGTGTLPSDGSFDGWGQWVPLVAGGESWVTGMTVAEVLVNTRLAADAVGATKMDRCEDVQPSLRTGKVYVVCTNNTDRGKVGKERATEPNPRHSNKDGHIVEITETGNDNTAGTFRWNLFLVCGNPSDPSTYFAGYPRSKVSPISCPDNVAFDSQDNMWIATDGAPSAQGWSDGLYKVPLRGSDRGRVQQFLAVPREAETCGPVVHDKDGLVFVAVQHPGEEGSWADQHSFFPDYVPAGTTAAPGDVKGPRPSVVQVFQR